MNVPREALAVAMMAKIDESPSVENTMDDVAEAIAAVKLD